jgi:hypothetical protein
LRLRERFGILVTVADPSNGSKGAAMSDTRRHRKERRPTSDELRAWLEDYVALHPRANDAECVAALEADGYAMPPSDGWARFSEVLFQAQAQVNDARRY